MTTTPVERVVFSTSRAAEFLEIRALQTQTGQPSHRFGDVVLKELLDNALDAAETAGVQPDITVALDADEDTARLTVTDNGPGIPADVVARMLDFTTLTSDKARYRSPSRGAQGNALKTIIGIPYALGVHEPVIIEARGTRHAITVHLDPAGDVAVRHDTEPSDRHAGTSVTVSLPAGLCPDAPTWIRAAALVNPHACLTLAEPAHSVALCAMFTLGVPRQSEGVAPAGVARRHDATQEPLVSERTQALTGAPNGLGPDVPLEAAGHEPVEGLRAGLIVRQSRERHQRSPEGGVEAFRREVHDLDHQLRAHERTVLSLLAIEVFVWGVRLASWLSLIITFGVGLRVGSERLFYDLRSGRHPGRHNASADTSPLSGRCGTLVDMTTIEHAALVAGVREELVNLWADLEDAVRMAANGSWSGGCERLKDRIEALSDLVGPASWRDISIPFLLSETYRRVCEEIGHPCTASAEELAEVRDSWTAQVATWTKWPMAPAGRW